eukprot:5282160-Prorocentrum_lima.AAC.1
MTSSLVGSEMCIRDSSCSFLHWGAHKDTLNLPAASWSDCGAGSTDGWHCLLYTSDAADDM